MGETRDPALGWWSVFEGEDHKTGRENTLSFGADVNEPIVWPVTLRVGFIRDRVMHGVDVEVDEDFKVTVKQESLDLRTET